MNRTFLSLGTNIGNKRKNLEKAIQYINLSAGHIIDLSNIYESEPWGFEAEENFLNMVIAVISDLEPLKMIQVILEIEKKLGRVRNSSKVYSSRIIDIDILFYENVILSGPSLILPHPHLHNRRFVLEPLSEIAPDFVHPVMGMTISELLKQCPDKCKVWQLGPALYDL